MGSDLRVGGGEGTGQIDQMEAILQGDIRVKRKKVLEDDTSCQR